MSSTSGAGHKPTRGILKKSGLDKKIESNASKEAAHFDEMNILATHHPADKDYGHMKIEEPKTPYRHSNDDDDSQPVDPDELSERLASSETTSSRNRAMSTDEEDDNLSPQAKEKKCKFEAARKKHYNMKNELKKARELLVREQADIADDSDD